MSSFLGVNLRFKNQVLINLVTAPNALEPVARVDLYNAITKTAVAITSIKSFSIRRSCAGFGDSFSVVIAEAAEWNERTTEHAGQLSGQKKYWLKFYSGYRINGLDFLYPYFVGIPSRVTEDYGPTAEAITVTGYGLDYLLALIDGSVTGQTENISTIIQNLIDASDLDGSSVDLPTKSLIDEDINNDQAIQTIDYLMGAFPLCLIERYVDNLGNLVIREKQNLEAEFSYNAEIVMVLNRTINPQNLITVCAVTGSPLRQGVGKIYPVYASDAIRLIIYNHGFATGDLITVGGVGSIGELDFSYINGSGLLVTKIDDSQISLPIIMTQPDIVWIQFDDAWAMNSVDSVSAIVEDATGHLTDYGRKTRHVSNKFINSTADAAGLAQIKITDSINRMNQVRIKVPFNPYLRPGSIISVTENDRSKTSDKIYCEDLTATYQPDRESAHTITGHILPA